VVRIKAACHCDDPIIVNMSPQRPGAPHLDYAETG
jgi:hypothetical protein